MNHKVDKTALKAALSKYEFPAKEELYSESLVLTKRALLDVYRARRHVPNGNQLDFFVSCVFNILEDIGKEVEYEKLIEEFELIEEYHNIATEKIRNHFEGEKASIKTEVLERLNHADIVFGIIFNNLAFLLLKDSMNAYAVLGINDDFLSMVVN